MSTRAAPRDWDAATYERVSGPQFEWGARVLERLPLAGDETVLDAGCGSGRVTALLTQRLPRGRVIAVDASPSMVELARTKLRARDAAITCDLLELRLSEEVDAVFSTAMFHWIGDHARLFSRLHDALRPGGRLVAQCGGAGNVARLHQLSWSVAMEEPFDHYFRGWGGAWNFATAEETRERLLAVGFTDARCWLGPEPVRPPEPLAYLETVCLGVHLDRLPAELRRPYAERVLARLGERVELDYVRLNIEARRPA